MAVKSGVGWCTLSCEEPSRFAAGRRVGETEGFGESRGGAPMNWLSGVLVVAAVAAVAAGLVLGAVRRTVRRQQAGLPPLPRGGAPAAGGRRRPLPGDHLRALAGAALLRPRAARPRPRRPGPRRARPAGRRRPAGTVAGPGGGRAPGRGGHQPRRQGRLRPAGAGGRLAAGRHRAAVGVRAGRRGGGASVGRARGGGGRRRGGAAMKRVPALLTLEDGSAFGGEAFASQPFTVAGEVVFNTAMSGYQEVLTDPSYRRQIVCMAAPEIGNYGTTPLDAESAAVQVAGFVVRQAARRPSNWRARRTLAEELEAAGVPGMEGIDTRRLVRHLRTAGAMRGALSTEVLDEAELRGLALQAPDPNGLA